MRPIKTKLVPYYREPNLATPPGAIARMRTTIKTTLGSALVLAASVLAAFVATEVLNQQSRSPDAASNQVWDGTWTTSQPFRGGDGLDKTPASRRMPSRQ
jgi:hypothetical protein